MSGNPKPVPQWLTALRGVALVGRGRMDGMALFGATPEAFLASLAPLLAFPAAGAILLLLSGKVVEAGAAVLITLVAQLAPPVLSYTLARAWRQEGGWLRYATAYDWSQWAILAVMFVLLAGLRLAMDAGLSEGGADTLFAFGVGGYALWLHWRLARHGLGLSRWRATAMVLVVSLGTVLLVFIPLLARAALELQKGPAGS